MARKSRQVADVLDELLDDLKKENGNSKISKEDVVTCVE